MGKYNYDGLSSEDRALLELIHQSNITLNDIKWLNSKKKFKRYISIYKGELQGKAKPANKEIKEEINDEDIEVLDFTKTISLPSREILEIFDFAKRN